MLDRIQNINPQEKYKNGLKIHTHAYTVNRHDQDKDNSKDSALFSEIAKLMSKINWRILNIEFPSEDEMLFNFMVDELEFITIINFVEMYKESFQEFSIFKIENGSRIKKQTEVKMKVEKYKISTLDKPIPIETKTLMNLFERISKISPGKSFRTTNRQELNQFTAGLSMNINKELNYILEVIYTFISTRNKSRVKSNFVLKTRQNIPIIMQKVVKIYAE